VQFSSNSRRKPEIRNYANCNNLKVDEEITLEIKLAMCYIETLNLYRAVNTHRLGYKNQPFMLYREIIAVFSEFHTKHTNTLYGQNVELLNVKPGGAYNDHWALKG
jgi:hypothetical protein